MNDLTSASPRRALLVGVGALALLAALGHGALGALGALRSLGGLDPAVVRGATFDELLVAIAAGAVLLALPWCAVAVVATCLDAARGRTERRAGCPRVVHRWVLAACGLAVVVAAAPAQADVRGGAQTPAPSTSSASSASSASSLSTGAAPAYGAWAGARTGYADAAGGELLAGLPLPDRPLGPADPQREPSPPPTPTAPATPPAPVPDAAATPAEVGTDPYVVEPGDSLWAITAATLRETAAASGAPAPSAADVARGVIDLHAAHRTTVGPDPDLVHPGLVLDLAVLRAPDAPGR